MSFELRPYQLDAEQQARVALAGGKRRVVLFMPTGAGKTLTATSIITKATAKGRRVVFVANRKQLVAQTSAVLHRYGIEHGILQAENTCRLDARVLVASIDTIHVRGLPDDVGLIVIDECHGVAGSQKYRTLLARYNLVPTVGLSATPFAAGMAKHYPGIGGPLFEHLVVGATIGELIAGGYGLVVTCWTEIDEGLMQLSQAVRQIERGNPSEAVESIGWAMKYMNRWQDRDGAIGNATCVTEDELTGLTLEDGRAVPASFASAKIDSLDDLERAVKGLTLVKSVFGLDAKLIIKHHALNTEALREVWPQLLDRLLAPCPGAITPKPFDCKR